MWSPVLQGLPITINYKVDAVRDDALRMAVDLVLRKVYRQRHTDKLSRRSLDGRGTTRGPASTERTKKPRPYPDCNDRGPR